MNRMSIVKRLVFASACLLICLSLPACRARSGEPEQRYEMRGKVLNVDRKGATVTVAHEAIPGYMEAMAMPFKLKDERAFDILAPDDRVQAILVVAGDRSWLEELVVTRESADASTINAAGSTEPKPGDEVPDFSLVNQDGKRISLHKYKGQALVLTFIYTRCPLPDYCPLMTNQFAEIDKAIKRDQALYPETHLLSISVDPAFDTPGVLRSYGEQYTGSAGAAAFARWEFASGREEEVKKVATYFGMRYWQEAGEVIHSLRTAVIAPDGKLARLYTGSDWKPADILGELRSIKTSGGVQANATRANAAQTSPTQTSAAQTSAAQRSAAQAQDVSRDKDAEKIYYGVGVIEEIRKDMSRVQINHEDIKDFMPAMSMPYVVKDGALLDGFAVGDQVKFGLRATPGGMIVISMEKR
jgi:protein SCO1